MVCCDFFQHPLILLILLNVEKTQKVSSVFMNTPDNMNKTLDIKSFDTDNTEGETSKTQPGISLQIFFAHFGSVISRKVEDEYMTMVPARFRASILRYKRWQDRQATLFGKMLLFRALHSNLSDTAMQKFQYQEVGQHGKPFIAGGPEFNISHSGNIVVLALAESGELGIDIEEIRAVNFEEYSLYLPEITNLHKKLDAYHANNLFFDCWTRKEAVLKACGEGLLAPLEQVILKEDTAHFLGKSWFIEKLLIEEGYCCHVATDQPVKQVAVKYVNLLNFQYDFQMAYAKDGFRISKII